MNERKAENYYYMSEKVDFGKKEERKKEERKTKQTTREPENNSRLASKTQAYLRAGDSQGHLSSQELLGILGSVFRRHLRFGLPAFGLLLLGGGRVRAGLAGRVVV